MNNKKESILSSNIYNFIDVLNKLNTSYYLRDEANIYKYTCILEREATRLYTHFEDWTTIKTDIQFKNYINKRLISSIQNINDNLKDFIKEQQDSTGMMYYTYNLLHNARLI